MIQLIYWYLIFTFLFLDKSVLLYDTRIPCDMVCGVTIWVPKRVINSGRNTPKSDASLVSLFEAESWKTLVTTIGTGPRSNNNSDRKMEMIKLIVALETFFLSKEKGFNLCDNIWIFTRQDGSNKGIKFKGKTIKNHVDMIINRDWSTHDS